MERQPARGAERPRGAGATLATWSVAGRVCAALNDAGWRLRSARFSVKRGCCAATGHRCRRCRGTRTEASDAGGNGRRCQARSAIVIGAELAGSSAAQPPAARGWQVTLVDSADGPGEGASGNLRRRTAAIASRDDNVLA